MSRSRYRPKVHFGGHGPHWFRRFITIRNRRETKRLARLAMVEDAEQVWPIWNRPRLYWF